MSNFTEQLFTHVHEKEVANICEHYSLLRRSLFQSSAEVVNKAKYTSTDISFSNVSTLSMDDILDSLVEQLLIVEDKLFLSKLSAVVNETGNKLNAHGTIKLQDVVDTVSIVEKTNRKVEKCIIPRGMIFDFINSEFKNYVDPCCDRALLLMGHVGQLYGTNITTVSAKVKKDSAIMDNSTLYAVTGDEDLGIYAFNSSIKYDSKQDILTITHKVYCEINKSAVASLVKIELNEEAVDE